MCGIAGVYLRDPKAKADLDGMLTTMLDEIEHRGGDATGFVALDAEGVKEWQKAACGAREFRRERRSVPKGTRTILAHTRWATQGLPAFVENNHPLRRGSFYIIHNGHVSNDAQLFELAERERYGRVDSEAIAARFASLGSLAEAAKLMSEIRGAAAIAAVDESKPGELVLARGHSSPLFVLETKRYVLWGSTYNTVREAYEDHIGRLPKKAKIVAQKEGTVLHYVDGKLTKSSFKPYSPPKVALNITLPWKETSTEGGYLAMPEASSFVSTGKLPSSFTDEDLLDCDICSEAKPWSEFEFVKDTDNYTWQICQVCDPALLEDAVVYDDDDNDSSDDFSFVNQAVLEED